MITPESICMFSSRRAITLVEMVLSMVILSVVLLGAQSAVLVAGKAVPNSRSVSESTASAANALDQLTADLRYARSFSVMSANAVVFTVPDRTGDGQPETIRYQWSGTANDPLTRQVNDGSPTVLIPAAHFFELRYDTRSTSASMGITEGPETTLASYDASTSLSAVSVTNSNWRAQHFTPTLPANAISWRVTRMFVKARVRGASLGEVRVQVRPAVGGKPSTAILGEAMLYENTLNSSFAWKEIPITQDIQLSPAVTACLVLQWNNDHDACEIQYRSNLLFGEPVYCMLSGSGTSWSASNDVMLYYIFGRATTPTPTETTYNLTAVRCALQAPSASSPLMHTTVRTISEPEVDVD